MTLKLNPDFADLLAEFVERDVHFLVIGGYAVGVHAVERATKDLDLLVAANRGNADRVLAALVAFGAPVGLHGVRAEDLATPGTVYQIGVPPHRIDVLTEASAVEFEQAWSRRVEVEVDGLRVPVIGLDDLIANKRAVGRPQDLADLDTFVRLGLTGR